MHTGHKAVLNDETEWVRLENHHTAIIDRALFEKANEMHPKKRRIVAESRTNFTLERRKKQPALLICANCGHSLLKETEHLLKCSDARTNGDPVCRSLVIRSDGNRWRKISLDLSISMQRHCWKKKRNHLPKVNANIKRSILQNCKNRADN